jgi:hypothetical protein
VAVNVTEEPIHIGLAPAVIAIDTDGTRVAFTVIVIPELVAVVGLAQGELDVIIQVTMSPFTKVVVVKIVLFIPVFTPFTCH